MNRLCRLLVLAAALGSFSAAAQYPGKPVRIVVPFSPGGTTDILARAVGRKLTDAWSQPIVIDNRPGASGMIGAETVAKAPPDGYTVLMASVAEVAINQSLYARMTYDPLKDLAPVTLAGFTPLVLVVHPRSEEHTSELQSQSNLVCRLLLEKKKKKNTQYKQQNTH